MTDALNRYVAGKGYIEAIKMILTSPHYPGRETLAILPSHLLAGFAVELHLKAWLLGSGTAPRDVRSYGHDLKRLYQDAVGKGLPSSASLSEAVDFLADPHGDYTFRYMEPGTVNVANWNALLPVLDALDVAVDTLIGASASKGLQPGH